MKVYTVEVKTKDTVYWLAFQEQVGYYYCTGSSYYAHKFYDIESAVNGYNSFLKRLGKYDEDVSENAKNFKLNRTYDFPEAWEA